MATRNTPLYLVDGTVKIYAPRALMGKGKYYRIVYPFQGGYKDTTALTEARAKALAGKFARALKLGGDFRFQLSGNEFLDAYLNPKTREVNGRSWGANHALAQKSLLNMYVRPVIGTLACSDITNEMLKAMVKGAKTVSIGEHLSSSLHSLVKWGHLENWVTDRPEELLKGLSNTVKKIKGVSRTNVSGENLLYIHPNEIPTHEDVAKVAKAAAAITGIWWYELLFMLAAYSGMRIGEIIDLDITQIDTKAKTIRIENQCLEVGGKKNRTSPKLGKFRTTIYPTLTPTNYPLAEQLKRRIKEIEEKKDVPVLLDGSSRRLLFHNQRGSWISRSSFASKIRRPAQKIAGWPLENRKYKWTFHSLRHVFCSYYLGDLNQSAQNVAICAGHSDVFTTLSMYVGASRDAIEKMSSAN
ncbi:MAG: site-specific integrase [Streptomycetaceae bacterium]|nr:MAG: site-specific integrase [Streptomycetaceae bacterium]